MAVDGGEVAAVVDLHVQPVLAPAGEGHLAPAGRDHRSAAGVGDVDSGVILPEGLGDHARSGPEEVGEPGMVPRGRGLQGPDDRPLDRRGGHEELVGKRAGVNQAIDGRDLRRVDPVLARHLGQPLSGSDRDHAAVNRGKGHRLAGHQAVGVHQVVDLDDRLDREAEAVADGGDGVARRHHVGTQRRQLNRLASGGGRGHDRRRRHCPIRWQEMDRCHRVGVPVMDAERHHEADRKGQREDEDVTGVAGSGLRQDRPGRPRGHPCLGQNATQCTKADSGCQTKRPRLYKACHELSGLSGVPLRPT